MGRHKVDDDEDDDMLEVVTTTRSAKHTPPSLRLDSSDSSPIDVVSTTDGEDSNANHVTVQPVSTSNWLEQLAEIATGPKSPLIQKQSTAERSPTKSFLECSLHSYARPPRTRSPSPVRGNTRSLSSSASESHFKYNCDESESRVSSSSPFPSSPLDDSYGSSGSWSHSWPSAVWQCFIQGTRIRFTTGNKTEWQLAEDLANTSYLTAQASQDNLPKDSNYAPNGLTLLHIEECKATEQRPVPFLRLRFSSDIPTQSEIIAECALDHPFFVREKGWSSFHPSMTVEHYGIPCSELEVGDITLPPSHPEATFTVDVFESFKSYDFTPMDSSAVFTLSTMAKKSKESDSWSPKSSPTTSPNRKRLSKPESPSKAKRPMNAFMLFAKKYRVEYTQMYPGKDNRAISCLLGERWKKLKSEERKAFSLEAKMLADQHKKIHPDCWKRKRSTSTGSLE
ncbi:HMG box-containing protein 1 isoform X2 [Lingula anatina]|uniref:HMG box-containing protein 1 n=1 Tax=Lingula anatina TaxID=7574 RepID=A0A1S3JPS8_LINAN|nr:HMG box-containing protein 1 isoform X2 [Lingula anatina]|eukprot:XP_013412362.1 HMG box-containing protein 1 isoform X2 [Lingula anatina]